MLFANDFNDNKIYIDDTVSNQEYYCPYCGVKLARKMGDIRQHHFAHLGSHRCKDTWFSNYDMSDWHTKWQMLFPKVNQEVKVQLGDVVHRADVLVDKTVIEFQHSPLNSHYFNERNNFYLNLNYKAIWLFDLREEYNKGKLSYKKESDHLAFTWYNPNKSFKSYDIESGTVELFFQINDDENCVVRAISEAETGFNLFSTEQLMSKDEFVDYVKSAKNELLPPCMEIVSLDESYLKFKDDFKINLNSKQEIAVQSVDGANLLLAVPGSGKTTVLIARLGYMVLEKKIEPRKILVLTYNKQAVNEIKKRIDEKFGSKIGNSVDICTINKLSKDIYYDYFECEKTSKIKRKVIDNKDLKSLIRDIYKKHNAGEYPTQKNIIDFQTLVSFIKNNMLEKDKDTLESAEKIIHNFKAMFEEYNSILGQKDKMDFDDQMVFAHALLKKKPYLDKWSSKYEYICVDEAQDTSKIQHEIIRFLSSKYGNVFMVGDEDQSIYGYRGSYPKALLNFRYDYKNPYIMKMETNYRSTKQITDAASKFINRYTGRYSKNIISDYGNGEDIRRVDVKNRKEQYKFLLEEAKKRTGEMAILYRDNETAVALIDLFLRNNIPYIAKKSETSFFDTTVALDIISYLRFAINENDYESFRKVCNKGIIYPCRSQREAVISRCIQKQISVLDSLEIEDNISKTESITGYANFKEVMSEIKSLKPSEAIDLILGSGYDTHMLQKNMDISKIEILSAIADNESSIESFIKRTEFIKDSCENNTCEGNPVILSTIHSSKGLEYDTVYLADIFDGKLPSDEGNEVSLSKDNYDYKQEDRRLFYVGMTRAKYNLTLISMEDYESSFIEEICPRPKKKHTARATKYANQINSNLYNNLNAMVYRNQIDVIDAINDYYIKSIEKQEACSEDNMASSKTKEEIGYEEVKDRFDQQEEQIWDSFNTRWVKCEVCGKIRPSSEFVSYGGEHHMNLGLCDECHRKNR